MTHSRCPASRSCTRRPAPCPHLHDPRPHVARRSSNRHAVCQRVDGLWNSFVARKHTGSFGQSRSNRSRPHRRPPRYVLPGTPDASPLRTALHRLALQARGSRPSQRKSAAATILEIPPAWAEFPSD
jgi:hypothetical protein